MNARGPNRQLIDAREGTTPFANSETGRELGSQIRRSSVVSSSLPPAEPPSHLYENQWDVHIYNCGPISPYPCPSLAMCAPNETGDFWMEGVVALELEGPEIGRTKPREVFASGPNQLPCPIGCPGSRCSYRILPSAIYFSLPKNRRSDRLPESLRLRRLLHSLTGQ
ncbi:hypothetical protein FA13DRAFT_880478 [Coprinellus micaceus]|uniref:Uncharacterized protein n=1 Tax=Coprinellus micaceus TaxID=71717 RepID=A0A4Y7S064_COPMI|nr:hypothetical protein FA13DRAFT_880478 [Coprinellus micaceus]